MNLKEVWKLMGWEALFCEVNLLLALYKSGKKHYLKEEEGVIDLAINYLSQAIEGFHNHQETQKTGIYTLTKKALKAEEAYHLLLIGLKGNHEIETLLPKYIKTLKKTKTGHDIEPQKIDNLIQLFRVIIFKIRAEHRYNNYLGVQACPA